MAGGIKRGQAAMQIVPKNGLRNNFVTGLLYNKMYCCSDRSAVERILRFFTALVFRAVRLLPMALSAARQDAGFFYLSILLKRQKAPAAFCLILSPICSE